MKNPYVIENREFRIKGKNILFRRDIEFTVCDEADNEER
jgi:hypothetical protein